MSYFVFSTLILKTLELESFSLSGLCFRPIQRRLKKIQGFLGSARFIILVFRTISQQLNQCLPFFMLQKLYFDKIVLEPVCCKKRPKIVRDQSLVWGIRAL